MGNFRDKYRFILYITQSLNKVLKQENVLEETDTKTRYYYTLLTRLYLLEIVVILTVHIVLH